MERLPAVLHVLHDVDEENDGDRCVEACGLSRQKDLNFIGLLATFWMILGDTKFLNDIQDTFVRYRDEASFEELRTAVPDIAQQRNISTERISKR